MDGDNNLKLANLTWDGTREKISIYQQSKMQIKTNQGKTKRLSLPKWSHQPWVCHQVDLASIDLVKVVPNPETWDEVSNTHDCFRSVCF